MRVGNVAGSHAVRFGVTVGAVAVAPLLLVAGGPVRYRLLRHLYREDGPGLVDKEPCWVSPWYFVVNNALVLALCWPSKYVLQRAPSCLSRSVIGRR